MFVWNGDFSGVTSASCCARFEFVSVYLNFLRGIFDISVLAKVIGCVVIVDFDEGS